MNSDLANLKHSVYILVEDYKKQQDGREDNYRNNHVIRKPVIINQHFKVTKSVKIEKNGYDLLNKPFVNASVPVFVTNKSGKVVQAEIAKANKMAESLMAK